MESSREEKVSVGGHFGQHSCIHFLWLIRPAIGRTCLSLKMDFSAPDAAHVPSRQSVILPKNISSDNQKGLDLFD